MIAVLLASQINASLAQNHLQATDYSNYYEWFNQHSQTELLYKNNTTLYIFGNGVEVKESPCQQSEVLAQLNIGQSVKNIAYPEYYVPEDEINGYGDIWYHVRGTDCQGEAFNGYIWGALIAKAWQKVDIDNDEQSEFIMLGVSSNTRKELTDINAEIRMVKDGKIGFQQTLPGLCVFEDCATSTVIREVKTPTQNGLPIIEASTMTIGCDAGIEKTLMVWDGLQFEVVYHSEVLTQTTFRNNEFIYTAGNANQESTIQVCRFSHENQLFDPIWVCKGIPLNQTLAKKPKA